MSDVQVLHGDALAVLPTLDAASVDSVCTDPPYGLGFMGKEWDSGKSFVERKAAKRNTFDHVGGNHNPTSSADAARTRRVESRKFGEWCELWTAECFRVLKPGGHLLAFGGTRTFHRLTCAIEDAGFEIRDTISWLYGSGFPKSLDVSKAIDKAAGAERPIVGLNPLASRQTPKSDATTLGRYGGTSAELTAASTDDARRWEGWGTALKPAHEPIVVARKPLAGTVAANVLAHGTGALNIDACRIEGAKPDTTRGGHPEKHRVPDSHADAKNLGRLKPQGRILDDGKGRWPTNVVLDDAAAAELDRQSGTSITGRRSERSRNATVNGTEWGIDNHRSTEYPGDSGGASRFFPTFRYEAKADAAERPRVNGTAHPTVKPLDLMRWLVRLVTPPGGLVLDPFAGSGTTGEACLIEGFRCVLVEREDSYLPLIRARLDKPIQPVIGMPP